MDCNGAKKEEEEDRQQKIRPENVEEKAKQAIRVIESMSNTIAVWSTPLKNIVSTTIHFVMH